MSEPWWVVASSIASVTTAPVLQAAADGCWESARPVPLTSEPAPARTVLEQVTQTAKEHVAVEILWPAQAFVGVRWPADSWEHAAAAASRAGGLFADGSGPSRGRTVEAGLLTLLDAAPATEPEFVELGAVNAWRSVGPETLWRRGDTRTDLESVLARRPDLASCAHPLAIELAVTHPRPCWVGIYVSTSRGGAHHLDLDTLKDILQRVI